MSLHCTSWPARSALVRSIVALWACLVPAAAMAQNGQPLLFHVDAASQKLEMTVNSSRILTTDKKVPQVQVNNPDLLELTPLSATQVQVHAKKAGVTQVNLWDENNQIKTVDVIIFGDAQELNMVLRTAFPRSSLRVIPLANSAILSGYVDRADDVERIVKIAEDFYPKIINAITVGGVQQVLLEVKVAEVSRTRLRNCGFDWADFASGFNGVQTISGLISHASATAGITTSGNETFSFGVIDGGNSFFGVIEFLRQNDLAKVLAEPKLVTVSGRPAFFNAGGEFPILVPQSLGTVSVQFRRFGTQVDFVPIVLGNGAIRLEVRPRVSEIDASRSVTIGGNTIPGLRVREIDTGAELRAGQTLAVAGLVQERREAQTRGIPLLMDVPGLGMLFSRVHEQVNEIELLIMVTPHLVDAMDPHEVPPCAPGTMTDSPSDCELYVNRFIEVPKCCPPQPVDPGSMQSAAGMGTSPAGQGMMVIPPGAQQRPVPEFMPAPAPEAAPARPAPPLQPDSSRLNRPNALRPAPRVTSNNSPGRKVAAPPASTAQNAPSAPARPRTAANAPARATDVRQAEPGRLRAMNGVSVTAAKPGFLGATGYDTGK